MGATLFRHKPAQTVPADGREAAVGTEARWSGGVLAFAAALFSVALALFPLQTAPAAGTVNVLYCGSLVTLMEGGVGPAFEKATGDQFRGYSGGFLELANQIKAKLGEKDVFIGANPQVVNALMREARVKVLVRSVVSQLLVKASAPSQ